MSTLDRYTCLETVARLADYLDHELAAAETVEVERHLSTCERCLARFQFEASVLDELRTARFQFEASVLDELRTKLRRVTVPEQLAERLRRALGSS